MIRDKGPICYDGVLMMKLAKKAKKSSWFWVDVGRNKNNWRQRLDQKLKIPTNSFLLASDFLNGPPNNGFFGLSFGSYILEELQILVEFPT